MSAVDLARLQFATTSIYHFLFVPLTIGLGFLTALLQTAWHRSGRPEYLRLTRFFGTLLVINIAVGVVTGLVQEFQFGMNWSAYSRFVGDVFGAPLAMEGLAAFFLESVFLGLWLFGWDRLPKRVHLATIWAVALGAAGSAAFIMAANSWMQRPVGYQLSSSGDRAQLTDIWAVLTNVVFLWAYLHVIAASLVTAALSCWRCRPGTCAAAPAPRCSSGRRGSPHRERPPAVDRPGPATGQGCRLAVGDRDHDRRQPVGVRPRLPRPGGRRRVPDVPLRPQGARPRHPGRRGRGTRPPLHVLRPKPPGRHRHDRAAVGRQ
jgi:Cytochrome bd terminal oxidase subunit I